MITRAEFLVGLGGLLVTPVGISGCGSLGQQSVRIHRSSKLQAAVDQARTDADAPGFVAVVTSGRTVFAAVSGYRTTDLKHRVTLRDRWHIGSVTKMMTAHLVAAAVETGLVSWDSTIGSLFEVVEPNIHPQYYEATLTHFLSHRSGMQLSSDDFSNRMSALTHEYISAFGAAGPPPIGFVQGDFTGDPRIDRLHWTRAALQEPPVAPLGQSKRIYENGNYIVLASVLEHLFNQSYEEMMCEQVFVPLGMANAGFGPPGAEASAGSIPTDPYGHRRSDGSTIMRPPTGPPRPDNPPVLSPSGRIHVSPSDIARFMQDHLAGTQGRDAHLSAETYQKLHTPPFGDDYAMGWIVRDSGGIGHGGTNGAWLAVLEIRPDVDVGAFVATNLGPPQETAPAANSLIDSMFAIFA